MNDESMPRNRSGLRRFRRLQSRLRENRFLEFSGWRPISSSPAPATSFSISAVKGARTVFTTTPPFVNVAVPDRKTGDALRLRLRRQKDVVRRPRVSRLAGAASERGCRSFDRGLFCGRNLALHRRHRPARRRIDGRRAPHRHQQRNLPERIQSQQPLHPRSSGSRFSTSPACLRLFSGSSVSGSSSSFSTGTCRSSRAGLRSA